MQSNPTIVFDLDGTLADTILDLIPSLNRTIAREGLLPVNAQQVGHVSGKGIKPMISLAYDLNNQTIAENLIDELFDIYMKDYEENIAVDTVLFDGAEECLKRFETNGWNLAVCTNKPVALADKLLRELDCAHYFSSVTGGDSFTYRKPDAAHLNKTIELAGGSVGNALMVGDSQNDILTAQNANIPVIAVDFGYSEHPVETYEPNHVISAFDDLFDIAQSLI